MFSKSLNLSTGIDVTFSLTQATEEEVPILVASSFTSRGYVFSNEAKFDLYSGSRTVATS